MRASTLGPALVAWLVLAAPGLGAAQVNMPNPREMSGVPLPVADLPAGTVSVRVIRGDVDNNLSDVPVTFMVDGEARTVPTGPDGRAVVEGLVSGARVTASAVVDGERLESQPIVVANTGVRVMLVALDPEAVAREAEDRALAAAAAVPGMVVLGSESRVVAEMQEDRLMIFYVLDVQNTARTPVDIGGPLEFALPRAARGAAVLQGSSTQALANGPFVTVVGPFAPGSTLVQVGYELPFSGGSVALEQVWPATLQQVTVIMPQVGGVGMRSAQFESTRDVSDQGQPLILGVGPAIAAGQALTVELFGLPHHPVWPRYVALTLAGLVMAAGIMAAMCPGARPRRR